jgi:hypothetical protein
MQENLNNLQKKCYFMNMCICLHNLMEQSQTKHAREIAQQKLCGHRISMQK